MLEKIKERIRERKFEKEDKKKVGTKIVIQYKDLHTPFYWVTELDWGRCHTHSLKASEIDELYTAIEYLGEGKYKDLVSGKVFIPRIHENIPYAVYTHHNSEEAKALETRLVTYPLGFDDDVTHSLEETKVDKIIEETIPKKELITQVLEKKEAEARKYVIDYLLEEKKKVTKDQDKKEETKKILKKCFK